MTGHELVLLAMLGKYGRHADDCDHDDDDDSACSCGWWEAWMLACRPLAHVDGANASIARLRAKLDDGLAESDGPPVLARFEGRVIEVGELDPADGDQHGPPRPSVLIACRDATDARAAGGILYSQCTFVAVLR